MSPDAAELLRRARALIPAIAAAASEGERERRVPPGIVAQLKDAGMFRAVQPKRWGGYELPPTALYAAEMAIAEGDMSTAWIVGVLGIIPWAVAMLDDRAGADVWGEDDATLVCAALRRAGEAARVEGGWRLSGQWAYGSGSAYAGWALLGAAIGDPPEGDALMLVPRRDFELLDTWHVAGLRATGSNDMRVKDAFVPSHRVIRMIDLFACRGPGQGVNASALYRLPFGLVFAGGVSNAAVGALQGMLDGVIAAMRGRSNDRRGGDPDLPVIVAEAGTVIDEAQTMIERNFARLFDYAERGEAPPIELRLQVKYQLSLNTERCRVAANKLLEAAGARALYDEHPYGRVVADITAGRQHITNAMPLHARDWGQVTLGQPRRHDFML